MLMLSTAKRLLTAKGYAVTIYEGRLLVTHPNGKPAASTIIADGLIARHAIEHLIGDDHA